MNFVPYAHLEHTQLCQVLPQSRPATFARQANTVKILVHQVKMYAKTAMLESIQAHRAIMLLLRASRVVLASTATAPSVRSARKAQSRSRTGAAATCVGLWATAYIVQTAPSVVHAQ